MFQIINSILKSNSISRLNIQKVNDPSMTLKLKIKVLHIKNLSVSLVTETSNNIFD